MVITQPLLFVIDYDLQIIIGIMFQLNECEHLSSETMYQR